MSMNRATIWTFVLILALASTAGAAPTPEDSTTVSGHCPRIVVVDVGLVIDRRVAPVRIAEVDTHQPETPDQEQYQRHVVLREILFVTIVRVVRRGT